MKIIGFSIDLNKIDKSRFIEGKNGAKYYNMTMNLRDEKDQYGNDGFISEAVSKEEREAKQYGTIIGNCKVLYSSDGSSVPNVHTPKRKFNPVNVDLDKVDDDLPF